MRADHRIIIGLVADNKSVLDLGCGRGELLSALGRLKNARGQGVEIDQQAITGCIRAGVNVLYGDLDQGLSEYPDGSFDYVILNNSIPEVGNPEKILLEALRVGGRVIVGFGNFCQLRSRVQICLRGTVPVNRSLPYHWYDTPNRHFLGIRDFLLFCRARNIAVLRRCYLAGERRVYLWPNLLADYGVFLLAGKAGGGAA